MLRQKCFSFSNPSVQPALPSCAKKMQPLCHEAWSWVWAYWVFTNLPGSGWWEGKPWSPFGTPFYGHRLLTNPWQACSNPGLAPSLLSFADTVCNPGGRANRVEKFLPVVLREACTAQGLSLLPFPHPSLGQPVLSFSLPVCDSPRGSLSAWQVCVISLHWWDPDSQCPSPTTGPVWLKGMKRLALGGCGIISPGEDWSLGWIYHLQEAFCIFTERCLGEAGAWDSQFHPVFCYPCPCPQPHCHPQNCSAFPSPISPYFFGALWLCEKLFVNTLTLTGEASGVMLRPVIGQEGPSLASPSLAGLVSASLSDQDERESSCRQEPSSCEI